MPSPDPESAALTDTRVVVGCYRTPAAARERSLVPLAMGASCWLELDPDSPLPGAQRLLVEATAAPAVRVQLARFERESAYWPPRAPIEPPPADPHRGLFPPLLWALVLVAVFRAQQIAPGFTEQGLLDTRAMWQHGELWRAFTALFLHADIGHLVSNLVAGWFVLRTWFCLTPLWRGWVQLLGSATLANVALALAAHAGGHRSLGASTLVFAGLGLLTGRALRRRGQPGRWRPLLVPAAAGGTMLALYGAGGLQTDVLAHVAGFVSGTLIGTAFSKTR